MLLLPIFGRWQFQVISCPVLGRGIHWPGIIGMRRLKLLCPSLGWYRRLSVVIRFRWSVRLPVVALFLVILLSVMFVFVRQPAHPARGLNSGPRPPPCPFGDISLASLPPLARPNTAFPDCARLATNRTSGWSCGAVHRPVFLAAWLAGDRLFRSSHFVLPPLPPVGGFSPGVLSDEW